MCLQVFAYREVVVFVLVVQELQSFVVAFCEATRRGNIHHHCNLVGKRAQSALVAINIFYCLQSQFVGDVRSSRDSCQAIKLHCIPWHRCRTLQDCTAEITLVLSALDEHAESAVEPQCVPLAESACVHADSLAVSQLPVVQEG